MQTTIVIIALVLTALSGIAARIISGIDNAIFYAKGKQKVHQVIAHFIENVHRVETPRYYSIFTSIFALTTALLATGIELPLWPAIIHSAIFTIAISWAASPFYQGFINLGSGLPFIDPNEKQWSEFALPLIGSFWWPRLGGYFRLLYTVGGLMGLLYEISYIIGAI